MKNPFETDYVKCLQLRGNLVIHLNKKPIKDNKRLVAATIRDSRKVLDIGAGDKRMERYLNEAGFQGEYFSMDVDKRYPHNFHDIDAIDGVYGSVLLLELIEHLDLNTCVRYLSKAIEVLEPGGHLVVSTPNTKCVGHLWDSDITHIQPYPLRDTCVLLAYLGCKNDFQVYKTYMRYFYGKEKILEPINKILRRIMAMDYAQGILIFSRKEQ